jgi:hypothetical protein
MLHTGWCEWFLAPLTGEERQRTRDGRRATGIAQTNNFVDLAWDHRLALLPAEDDR